MWFTPKGSYGHGQYPLRDNYLIVTSFLTPTFATVLDPDAIFEEVQSEAAVPNPTPDTSPERPRPNELWRHRDSGIEFKVTRTARRSVFGILTIPGVNLSTSSQLLYTQIDAKWERVHA